MTLRYCWVMFNRVFFQADTTTIRLILANGSFVWAFSLLLDPHAFDRRVYTLMDSLAPQPVWMVLFALHFMGVYWRLLDVKARIWWALAVNGLGFALWFISTAAINVAVGTFSQTSSLELTMVAASGWALFRTGLRPEIVSP